MNCRARNSVNPLTSVGSATPTSVFVRCTLLRIRKVGIIVTWMGIIIVARTSRNITFRPRKRNLAKP